MIVKNSEETARRKFAHRRSYVAIDNREILHGLDWERRKCELWKRASGKCEYFKSCSAMGEHPHHVQKRSDGRDDRLANLKLLCGYHHKLAHPEKQVKWSKR